MRSYDSYCDSLSTAKPCRVCEYPSNTDVCAECVEDMLEAETKAARPVVVQPEPMWRPADRRAS